MTILRKGIWLLGLVPLACGVGEEVETGEAEPAAMRVDSAELDADQVAALMMRLHGAEIAAGNAAEEKLVLEASREYARLLMRDHTLLMAGMPGMQGPMIAPPHAHTLNAILNSQAEMILTLPSGPPFDAMFAAIQIADHSMALDSLRRWRGIVTNTALQQSIENAIPVMELHLLLAQSLYERTADELLPAERTVRSDTAAVRTDTTRAGRDTARTRGRLEQDGSLSVAPR